MCLPRDDLEVLGVRYRRIPIMAIGRDIYCDTRLILQKLEQLYPVDTLGGSTPEQKAIQQLISKWVIEAGVFSNGWLCFPPESPVLTDPKFLKDREDLAGVAFSQETVQYMRPNALAQMRSNFEFLDQGILADERDWILNTKKPSLADIEGWYVYFFGDLTNAQTRNTASWFFEWLLSLKTALPSSIFSEKQYPKVFPWLDRMRAAVASAKSHAPEPETLGGEQAVKKIIQADFAEPGGDIDEHDPLGLSKEQEVEVWPTDTGSRHRDRGRLLKLTTGEIVIVTSNKASGKEIRIHTPRTGFGIQPATQEDDSKL